MIRNHGPGVNPAEALWERIGYRLPMTAFLWVLVVLLVVLGIAGTVLPALPGVPLVFAGLLLAAWIDGFAGWLPLVVLGLLTALSFVVDLAASALGAKRVGATKLAVVGALLGTVVGLFLGLPGLILGPFVGAVAGELISNRDISRAGKVGLGTWIGMVFGTAAKLALAFSMLGIFVAAWLI
ncbi:MAG: hypothetical protein H6Q02_2310 [Acidobacteria bacterium]|nr:hypothetical protein [Acidobacteriota bacterium]